jgi:uncharacterized membrane protein
MNERRIHQIFEVNILLKGAEPLIECIGGLVLALSRRSWASHDRDASAAMMAMLASATLYAERKAPSVKPQALATPQVKYGE